MEFFFNTEQDYWPMLVREKVVWFLLYEKIKAYLVPAWEISVAPG